MFLRTVALSLCLAAAAPALAVAQQQPNCADFHRNADGSWSPTHAFMTDGVMLDPGWRFYPGQVYGTTDVVAMLNQWCAARPAR